MKFDTWNIHSLELMNAKINVHNFSMIEFSVGDPYYRTSSLDRVTNIIINFHY